MAEISKPIDKANPGAHWKGYFLLAVLVLILIGVALGPGGGSPRIPFMSISSLAMQQTRAIDELMFAYADAHQGAYPTGKSSTEIFQKLIDENHMTPSGKTFQELYKNLSFDQFEKDTAIFWLDMPGKTMATSSVLKPENVCFDVTAPLDKDSPDDLPAVFVTGYKVTYLPGGTAVPLPDFRDSRWTAICYKSRNALAIFPDLKMPDRPSIQPDGTILNFIPATFNPSGKKYQQLTPDGPLTP